MTHSLPTRRSSDLYYDSGFLLMVPTDSTIKGAADLKGTTLAVKTGTSATDYAQEHFTETELRQFPNVDTAYLELQTGRVDAAMHATPNGLSHVDPARGGQEEAVRETIQAPKR